MPYPRALKKDGIQVEEFVSDLLEDLTTEKILSDPAQVTVMVEKIRMKGRPKVGGEGEGAVSNNDLGADAIIDRVKRTLDLLSREDDDDDDIAKPAAKKAKKEGAPAKISARDRARAEIWAQYEMLKADVLKDMLRWNRQVLGGKKNMLLVRIIDGQMNGRLARCPTCLQGRVSWSRIFVASTSLEIGPSSRRNLPTVYLGFSFLPPLVLSSLHFFFVVLMAAQAR